MFDSDLKKYEIPISIGSRIKEMLGRIVRREDGRFSWFRKSSKYRKKWNAKLNSEGVVDTKQEAVEKVLEGWEEGDIRREIHNPFRKDI